VLSQEDNELLVHVGPATPMGNLFRRFWTPVALVSELGGPDSPPVRVRVFGENFVAFRDSDGEAGLLDAYCPHRRASLFWGRNEARGLRCAYHGWKFDRSGQCTDVPNCPEGEQLASRVRIGAYPVLERGGILWAYLGPPERKPEFPAIEALEVPATHRHVVKIVADGNWLQFQEGDVDSSHVAFLHGRVDGKLIAGSRLSPNTYNDKAPRWFPSETAYGLMLAAQRDAGPDRYQWRVNQYLMPHVTLIANQPHLPTLAQIRTPIDDEHAILFRYLATYDRPLSDDERRIAETHGTNFPDLVPGTFTMRESRANDYAIDRDVQRNETFTGIKSTVAQDLAVTQEQGEAIIADRSREYLVSSDRAIIMLRKRLLTRVKELQDGREPPEPCAPEAYRVRSGDFTLPRDVAVTEGGKEILALA
jgi:phenylpropionate dioxygenase-like ring-hydroxylating dioxygenase large terminal subunit